MAAHGETLNMRMLDNDDEEDRAFARSHGVGYQPGFIIIRPGGEVFHASLGPFEGDEVVALVESALP